MAFFIISFLYAGINWFYQFMLDDLYLYWIYDFGYINANKYLGLLEQFHKYALAIIFATLAYTALRRCYKVLIPVIIPFLSYLIGYIFVDGGYKSIIEQPSQMVEYLGGIILTFLIILLGTLLKKYYASIVLCALLTWLWLLLFIFITFWSKNNWQSATFIFTMVVKEYLLQITAGVILTTGIFSFIDKRRENDFIY